MLHKLSTASQIRVPSAETILVLKETLLAVATRPETRIRSMGKHAIGFVLEDVLMQDEFPHWPPLTIKLSALVKSESESSDCMVIRYREASCIDSAESSLISHNYVLARTGEQTTRFSRSIHAYPDLPLERTQPSYTDEQLDQIQDGQKILANSFGNLLEVTEGDCYVLFDRVAQFLR